ncbi:ABC transporter ATP-binding protein [Clostridium polynesiense]|uniref:ABC transporter ATP-binding protein n=1 Tax=Clostridium polynesiense TaxID=1325933 RepID=UPI00058DF8A0|nr:ABC transporter ATP-binding protein [Clostridium polynesiense]
MIIEVKNLNVRYKDKKAVNNVSFNVNQGEVFGMIGANGAGKTTTIECIEGLRNNYDGEIKILGLSPKKDRKKLHKLIGVQLQETSYQDRLKVKEICRLFASFYEEKEDFGALAKEFGLHDKLNSYVGKLSGGQRQKLSIILALISKPKVIFLDELTTGLDPKSRKDMWETVLTLKNRGITIYLTTHFMEEAEYLCDRVAIMKEGKIAALDTVDNLKNNHGLLDKVSFLCNEGINKDALMNFESVKEVADKNNYFTISCDADGFLKELNQYVMENHCIIMNTEVKKPSLEDVFFKYTGDTLENVED